MTWKADYCARYLPFMLIGQFPIPVYGQVQADLGQFLLKILQQGLETSASREYFLLGFFRHPRNMVVKFERVVGFLIGLLMYGCSFCASK